MKHTRTHTLILLAASLASTSFAATEGTVLFAQPGTQIIEPSGAVRSVKRGDRVNTGDRLITGPGAIAQVKLLDGSLLGLRPESEMKITVPPAAADKSLQVVSLTKGAVRVIGSELMDGKKPSRFSLESGLASLKLKGADLESSIVPPTTGARPQGGAEAGSYHRMVVGTGSVGTGGGVITPLVPRAPVFVSQTLGIPPITLGPTDGTSMRNKKTYSFRDPTELTSQYLRYAPKFTDVVYINPAAPCTQTARNQQLC